MAHPTFDATSAVTSAVPPERVWPWLVQVGVTRAGWYSYDLLDDLGRPSARRIVPELQDLEVGDVVPMSPDGRVGPRVLLNVKERAERAFAAPDRYRRAATPARQPVGRGH